MSKYKVGDQVQLRSGGPTMTVYQVDQSEEAMTKLWVCWTSNANVLQKLDADEDCFIRDTMWDF